jgi:hypothetical protein
MILSHDVDDFTTFFLFLGCLNILLGLIFRKHANSKQSIAVWRSAGEDLTVKAPLKSSSALPPTLVPAMARRPIDGFDKILVVDGNSIAKAQRSGPTIYVPLTDPKMVKGCVLGILPNFPST